MLGFTYNQIYPDWESPEMDNWWTTLYYGHRGSGKTLHQAKVTYQALRHLRWWHEKKENKKFAIVFTNQKFKEEIEKQFLGKYLFYWSDASEIKNCPRLKCWRGNKEHGLHGAYLIFDDVSTILPSDNWNNTPIWLRKIFTQGRHIGVRVLANSQDAFSIDINFRRNTDMCFRFSKLVSSRDTDETKKEVKRIWGVYHRRKIKAEWLWKFGDMLDEEIAEFKDQIDIKNKITGRKSYLSDLWSSSPHLITSKICKIYDTTQDVKEYEIRGYSHKVVKCLDTNCKHIKTLHELV